MSEPLQEAEIWDTVSGAYTDSFRPVFTEYAQAALSLLGLEDVVTPQRAIDIACGPGTASMLFAKRGYAVDAIDFSEGMLQRCRAQLVETELNVTTHLMDGQALDFEDSVFSVACSMFGWMFFPDRARGLSEMRRVLRPGGRVALSSWAPLEDSPYMQLIMGALEAMMPPEMKSAASKDEDSELPLVDPDDFRAELASAGFKDIAVTRVTRSFELPDVDTFWDNITRGSAPLVLLRQRLGSVWDERSPLAKRYLQQQFDDHSAHSSSDAWIATATSP